MPYRPKPSRSGSFAATVVADRRCNVGLALELHPGVARAGVAHDIGQRLLHHAQQRLRLRDAVDARVLVDLQVDARRRGSGRDQLRRAPARMSRPSCWRICATTPRMSVQQFSGQLRGDLVQVRCALAVTLQRGEIQLERGELVAGDVVQLARQAQPLVIARALLEQRARGEQVRVGLPQLRSRSASARRAYQAVSAANIWKPK